MSTDSVFTNMPPPPDDALAALMASPDFQAQMAALTQQAMASLEGLVAALRAAEAQMAGSTPPAKPIDEPITEIPYGLAVEPIFLAPVDPMPLMPEGQAVTGVGVKLLPAGQSTGWARLAVEPSVEEITTDMLAVLPQPAAPIAVASAAAPAAASGTEVEFTFAFMSDDRNGAEGGPV